MDTKLGPVAGRPALGAAYLDEQHPGWAGEINLERLDIRRPSRCVLGQLGLWELIPGPDARQRAECYGMILPPTEAATNYERSYAALNRGWRQEIAKRLGRETGEI